MTAKDGRRLEEIARELEDMASEYAAESLTSDDLIRCAEALRCARAARKFRIAYQEPAFGQVHPHI